MEAGISIQQVPSLWPAAITMIAFLGVAWLAVTLRVFTRVVLIRSFGFDDYAMLVTLAFYSVYCAAAVTCSLIVSGHGSLTIPELTSSIQWLITMEVFYIVTMLTLKIAIGMFFLRITFRDWHRRIVYVALSFSTVFSIIYLFVAIFQCGYFSNALEFFVRRVADRCISRSWNMGLTYTHGGITTLTDCVFAILPFALLHGSPLSRKEKIIVGLILTLATLGGIASIVRLRYVVYLADPGYSFYATSTPVMLWSAIEAGLGIIAGSMATLRPLFKQYLLPPRNSLSATLSNNSSSLSRGNSTKLFTMNSLKLSRRSKEPIDFSNAV